MTQRGEGASGVADASGGVLGAGPVSGVAWEALTAHLGEDAHRLPVVTGTWPPYEHVNVQVGLDRWLAEQPGEHSVAGVVGFRHSMFGLADLCQSGMSPDMTPRIGGVATAELPAGPDGAVYSCVRAGLYFYSDGPLRMVLLLRGSEMRGPQPEVTLEVAATDPAAGRQALARVRDLAIRHSVYRGKVVSFGTEVFRPLGGNLLTFHSRPRLTREELILPGGVLEAIERQVCDVAEYRDVLLAHGQHLKRGLLLYGAPGVGKTHTVRYLISSLPETTVVILSGPALAMIKEACSFARSLQPAMMVVEDVDLIGEERVPHQMLRGAPLLFQLLGEMDGLGEDVDVTFVLTTNRVDVLEPALVSRPGRIDHAALIPLPDADGRRRLIDLYRGTLDVRFEQLERVLERTEGVTASFLKEMLRKAALLAAAERGRDDGGAPLRVTDRHVNAALDTLLDSGNTLTNRLLGGRGQDPQQA